MQRKITVYDSSTQHKVELENVEVSTLGELKRLFTRNNISYADMDFMEGISKTKLVDDNSVLPHDIPFRGGRTDDLLIYMTKKDKKVRSGIDVSALSRKDLLSFIKENGWVEEVNTHYGQNYTRVSSAALVSFCQDKLASTGCENYYGADKAIVILTEELLSVGVIGTDTKDAVMEALAAGESAKAEKKSSTSFTVDEIEEMMEDF